jgi:hypothetical protein
MSRTARTARTARTTASSAASSARTTASTAAIRRTGSSAGDLSDGLATYRRAAAGASLVLGTVLYGAGAALSPDQEDMSSRGYVASLAADPLQSDLSAAFLHWAGSCWSPA